MRLATEVSGTAWRNFLDSRAESSIFQSPSLKQVYDKTAGFRPFVFAAESGDDVKALVSGAIVSYSTGTLARFASRAIVVGGPIGEEPAFPTVLEALDRLAGKNALLTQIRNIRPPGDRSTFEAIGYHWQDHLNYIVRLDRSHESLWDGLSRNRRRGIEEGDRIGLKVVDVGRERLPSAYRLLQETYSRAGIPLADQSLFENALETLGESGHLWAFAATLSEKICAVRFILRWKTTLFDWYAGSSDPGRASHADEWLVWQVFLKGMEAGYVDFDFGGAGAPGSEYGPGEFKRRFGGVSINPGRFEKVYKPLTARLSKMAFEVRRRLEMTVG